MRLRKKSLPLHSNGMRFVARDAADGVETLSSRESADAPPVMRFSFVLPLATFVVVACSSSPERETPIPAGTYILQNDTETAIVIDEQGYFAWHARTCGDQIHASGGSLELEADGSIRVYACSTHQSGGAAYWAPDVPATGKLRARVTDSGFVVEGVEKGGRPFTQQWRRGDSCRSTCDCHVPDRTGGC